MSNKSTPKGTLLNLPPHPNKSAVRKIKTCLLTLLSFILVSSAAFGQSTSASLSGTISDASRAVLPGATVSALNTETNREERTSSNDSGVYNFANLPPGTYIVTAQASGFQRSVITDVRLRAATQSSLNFNLEVMGITTEVQVTASAENMVLEAGSSTGTVLQEDLVTQLPVLSGNVLELVDIMGGVVKPRVGSGMFDNPDTAASNATFAGVSANNINITRDGISINEVRYQSGINTPTIMNTETVGEFRMVLSPVDAELGRGAGQIQMTTRSGSNAFRGSAVWNIQNTALDANEWLNKNKEAHLLRTPAWRNLNNYTLTLSGPIFRDRTFFLVTWDHQLGMSKSYTTQTVLTPCARKGIYRYLDGALSGNAASVPSITTAYSVDVNGTPSYVLSGTRPSVDAAGNPLEQYTWPNETRYNHNIPANIGEAYRRNTYAGGLWDGPRDVTSDNIVHYAGATVNNKLMYQSVLGGLSAADRTLLGGNPGQVPNPGSPVYSNCDGYSISPGDSYTTGKFTNRWDPWRNTFDKSGFIQRYMDLMPMPNNYTAGDGLNTARIGWTRRQSGSDSSFGTGDSNRKSITMKIDHNINSEHRFSGSLSYDVAHSQDQYIMESWPTNSWGGSSDRTPIMFQGSLTSTLRPTLMNEFRIGLSRTASDTNNALGNALDGDKVREKLRELLPTDNWSTYEGLVVPRTSTNYGNVFGNFYTSTWGGKDQRWTVTENITWMKGAHSFKGGLEFRRSSSLQVTSGSRDMGDSFNVIPTIMGGNIGAYTPTGRDSDASRGVGPYTGFYPDAAWEGFSEYDRSDFGQGRSYTSTKLTNARNLDQFLSGQVGSVQQFFYTVDSKNPRWSESSNAKDRSYTLMNKELHLFFKDDWKITSNLTLNLGARWEYYGVPFEADGMTTGVKDLIDGLYGVSRNLDKWMNDFSTLQGYQSSINYDIDGTRQMFVGPNSGNPNIPVFNKDLNNFAPHVGFSWQLPWWGRGQTTMRGGYSISYSQLGNMDTFAGALINVPGIARNYTYSGEPGCIQGSDPLNPTGGCFITFDNVSQVFPLDVTKTGQLPFGAPGFFFPKTNYSSGSLTIYDPDIRNPYVQNLNLSVTRNLNRFLTLDVRYIGTLQRKQQGSLNLNLTNYFANGLFEEFRKLRAGIGDPKVLADFPILNSGIIPYKNDPNNQTTASLYAPWTGTRVYDEFTGAEQVLYSQWTNLSRGSFETVAQGLFTADFANDLRTRNNPDTGRPYRPQRPTYETAGQVLREGGAPDNLIYLNPQYGIPSGGVTNAVNINRNQGRSHYHSMQTQLTMRPVRGLSFQATWTWSRSLSRGGVLDYRPDSAHFWEREKSISAQHRSHTFNTYGSYEMPFGARGFFFRDASGAFKKAIEGWQLGWIGSLSTGSPMSLNGYGTVWSNNRSVQVGPFDPKDVGVKWQDVDAAKGERPFATYFNKEYMWVSDPQCSDTAYVRPGNTTVYPIPGVIGTTLQPMANLCGQIGGGRNALAEVASRNADGLPQAGQVIFQNSVPGQLGNKRGGFITSPGSWNLDASMSKSVEFMEGKRFEVRVDAQNIFNHPGPNYVGDPAGTYPTYWNARTVGSNNPNVTLTDPNNGRFFGEVNAKAGHRTFQARLRLSF